MATGKAEFKFGLYAGLGFLVAMFVLVVLQMFVLKGIHGVKRNG